MFLEFRDFAVYSEILGEWFSLYGLPRLDGVFVFLGLFVFPWTVYLCLCELMYLYWCDE